MSEMERLEDLRMVANAWIGWMKRALTAEEELAELKRRRPASEWTEKDGPVLWWYVTDEKINGPWASEEDEYPTKVLSHWTLRDVWVTHFSRIPAVELKEGK